MFARLFIPTLWRLGPRSVLSVAIYRTACRLGLYKLAYPVRSWTWDTDFFAPANANPPAISERSRTAILQTAENLLSGKLSYYGGAQNDVGNPPDWFLDPYSGLVLSADDHWSAVDEFASIDIKNVWEASRFQWLLALAQAWRLSGDARFVSTINNWLGDWVSRNPRNCGPNWKCGQEASLRLITLMLAARILGTDTSPTNSFVRLIETHCARIAPTIRYAIAQNNNHGTSEAAALFIGGAWLMRHAPDKSVSRSARRWRAQGRRWLEQRVLTLVAADGSFSQHSTNYHRLLVDTLSQVSIWKEALAEPDFSDSYLARTQAAVDWLAAMTDPDRGAAPNIGANDGSRLFDLSHTPYRDFRPSIQLASVLASGAGVYPAGPWNEPLAWLDRDADVRHVAPRLESSCLSGGGYAILRSTHSWSVVRFAAYRFRPSHADCLHLDLWHRGENILRDGGTFSYNTEPKWLDYFSGTESHNTVQIDGRDQMPRLGRFLFGSWLAMDSVSPVVDDANGQSWSGAYTDWQGATHRRKVSVDGDRWLIVDDIAGIARHAVLRWRLIPADWRLDGHRCASAFGSIHVDGDVPIQRIELRRAWESQLYQQRTELPVLEVEVGSSRCRLTSVIDLNS